jgi:ribokinase
VRTRKRDELDVVVIGGANTDYLIRGVSLPGPGSTVEGEEFQEAPGGKGANQAVAAARLGAKVAFLGRVGGDARGKALLAGLESEGVDVRGVTIDPEVGTGAALVMVDGRGEKQIMAAPGANHRVTPDDMTRAAELIARAAVVLLPLELPQPAVEAAIGLARAAGAHVVLDPAPARQLSEELLRDVHVIRPNAAEAEVLTGVAVSDVKSAKLAAENLLRRGVGAALIGAPGGTLLLSPETELWVPWLDVPAVDATGAGDAFVAALAVCIANGDELGRAARFANAAAALQITKLGARAGLPRRAQVERFARATRVRRHVKAPRALVYRALLDPDAVARWRLPQGMTSQVHEFDAREGGSFRVSLTYESPSGTGKSSAHTDTYHGRFVKLVPDEQVVESVEFETADPTMRGEMTMTTTLIDAAGGTDILGVHEGLPPGIAPADNETGWQQAFERLALLVEGDRR